MMERVFTWPYYTVVNRYCGLVLLLAVGLAGGVAVFPVSFITRTNVLIGFCLLPFVLSLRQVPRVNLAYLAAIILFGAAAYGYHVRMFYFFALAFYVFFMLELFIGKVSTLMLFLLAFMSPFFDQVAVILGFPIRLYLSQISGTLLQWAGWPVRVEGNMMLLNNVTFTVDEACMGLSMLSISLLMGVFLVAFQYQVQKKRVPFVCLMAYFASVFALNLVCNVFRIIVLVIFTILPDSPWHEAMGILCLCVYVVAPLYLLSRWMVARGKVRGDTASAHQGAPRSYVAPALLALGILSLGLYIRQQRGSEAPLQGTASLPGFEASPMNNGIIKLVSPEALVYVKPIPEFFTGEHSPLFCWRGSGYTFEGIAKASLYGKEVYIGQLQKQNARLATAWWYTNGSVHTIDQFDWRWRMCRGEAPFSLVNVTAENEDALRLQLAAMLGKKSLTIHY